MSAPVKKKGEIAKIRAYGYCRVSTEQQADEGDSFMVQYEKIKAFATLKGVELVETVQERVSGGVEPGKRPIMKEIFTAFKEGKANAIVVAKLDRFSRSLKDVILTIERFEKKGIHFFCVDPQIDTTNDYGKFLLHLFGALAEMEKKRIVQRTKEVMTAKREKGHLIGGIPFGFDVKLQDKDKILVPNEREQALIVRIKTLRNTQIQGATGKPKPMSYQAICDKLIEEDVPNKNGTVSWFPTQIRRICFDGKYKSGCKKKGKEEEIKEEEEE